LLLMMRLRLLMEVLVIPRLLLLLLLKHLYS
jgi:hypothetical protein